jgi:hypothetical protein
VVAPEKVPEAVDQLFHDPGLRQRIVQGGFATANERSPKRIASKLLSILEKCVDTHAN